MNVFKRKDGSSPFWYATFTDPITKVRQKVCLKVAGTRAEAELAAMRLVVARAPEPPPPPDPAIRGPITLGTAISAYCTAIERAGRVGAKPARALGAKVLRGDGRTRWHLDGSMELHTLTARTITQLVTARTREGASTSAIAAELRFLRGVIRQAARDGFKVNQRLLDGTRKDAWKVPTKASTAPAKVRAVTLDEFLKVYHWLTPTPLPGRPSKARRTILARWQDAQDVLAILALAGGRWSEVRALVWGRVDVAALHRWRAWNEAGGGASRPAVAVQLVNHQTRSQQTVDCPDLVCATLADRWRREKARSDERGAGDPSGTVFPGDVARRGDQGIAGRMIARAIDACGLNTPALVKERGRATSASLKGTFAGLDVRPDGKVKGTRQEARSRTAQAPRIAPPSDKERAAKLAGIMNTVTLRMGVQDRPGED